ncbi:unnamed protein product [Urochloa humidicola]
MLGVTTPKVRKGAPVKLRSMKEAPPPAVVATGGNDRVPAQEVCPGGMLAQKRGGGASDNEPSPNVKPVLTIRVKVKHAGVTHEIYISSEASFGELTKLVAAKTELHLDDQKVLYKDKERDSKTFLDMAGVKDRSKLVVVEDPEAKARRLIEQRRNGHLEKAARAVATVTSGVKTGGGKEEEREGWKRERIGVEPTATYAKTAIKTSGGCRSDGFES